MASSSLRGMHVGVAVDLSPIVPGGAVPHAAGAEPMQRALLQRLVPRRAVHVLQQQLLGELYRPGGSRVGVCEHRVRPMGNANMGGEHRLLHELTNVACSASSVLFFPGLLANS